MDPLAAIRDTFFQECEEQLAELESGLLAMEAGDRDSETINAVFRAVHSVKGGAGAFGLEALVRFSHVFETTLDDLRSGKLEVEDAIIKTMLRAADLLADHVRAARDGGGVDEGRSQAVAEELTALAPGGHGPDDASEEEEDLMGGMVFQPLSVDIGPLEPLADLPPLEFAPLELGEEPPLVDDEVLEGLKTWTIRFKPKRALYANANEASLLLRELDRLGLTTVTLDLEALPPLGQFDPEEPYLAWEVALETEADEAAIRDVFEFVEGDCDLHVQRPAQAAPAPAAAASDILPELPPPAPQEIDVAALIARAQEAAQILDPVAASAPAPAAARAGPPKAVEPPAAAGAPPAATIRVDLERVDRLINLVGELVINQAMLAQRIDGAGLARANDIAMGLDDLEQLTREIQDSVMAIRAQPVKSVFQRMPRLVREVAAMTGKRVRLVTDGEGTEVDKTVIERLTDPITHMIRNAIDHGLESPEARAAAGKPEEGTVKLTALHRGGRIVIEVKDDGQGINRPRVRQLAVDKGLIAAEAVLTDEEIDNLIFMPGFSTASSVSDISGRGVGMDVVKRSIQALGGRIAISSTPGSGSTFTLSLPLTLAVLDGMVVSVCGQTLVAPLSGIIETLQPKENEVRRLGPNATLIAIRETYVPLIDIGAVLGYRTEPVDPTAGVALLVESENGARAALLVDAIQGQRQVVIKSLESNYRHIVGIAAATILGDGRVALILDVDAVVSRRGEPALALAAAG